MTRTWLAPFLSSLVVAALAAGSALAHAATARARLHEVYPGQTLGMIARRYNVSIDDLCKVNGITRKSRIRPGQKLRIPGAVADQPPAVSRAPKADERRTAPAAPVTRIDLPAPVPSSPPAASGRPARGVARQALSYTRRPPRRGWVTLIGTTGDFVGFAVDKKGRATPAARQGFNRALGSWRTGLHASIDERLIQLVAQVSDHFGGRAMRAVSGFRPYSPRQYTAHSRHNSGEAIDFTIPGVPNGALRDYVRSLPQTGVGYYPNSSFVHLDMRPTQTYWVDYSRPGEVPRYAGADGRDPGPVAARQAPGSEQAIPASAAPAAASPDSAPTDPGH